MDTPPKLPQARSATRLIEALSTLAALLDRTINEVKTLDTDFQNRVLQAVHDTETYLQKQAAGHLQRSLEEAAQVSEERKVSLEGEMTAAIQAIRQELDAESEKLSQEQESAAQAREHWETERASMNAEIERVNQVAASVRAEAVLQQEAARQHLQQSLKAADQKTRAEVSEQAKAHFELEMAAAVKSIRQELEAENEKLSREHLQSADQARGQWEAERARMIAEIERANQVAASVSAEAVLQQETARQHLEAVDEKTRGEASAQANAHEQEKTAAVKSIRQELEGQNEKLGRELENAAEARSQWEVERVRLNAEVERANQAASSARTEAALQQEAARQHLQLSLEAADQKTSGQVSGQAKAHEQEKADAVKGIRQELEGENEKLRRELGFAAEARMEWDAERAQLNGKIERANQLAAGVRAEAVRQQEAADQKTSGQVKVHEQEKTAAVKGLRLELEAENEKLRRELENAAEARRQWEAERARMNAEIERANQAAAGVREEAARQQDAADKKAIGEVKVHEEEKAVAGKGLRQELETENEKLRRELGFAAEARVEWDAERAQLNAKIERTNQVAAGLQAETVRLQQAAKQQLPRPLEAAAQNNRGRIGGTAALKSIRQELDTEKQKLSRELDRTTKAAALWETERARLNAEIDRMNQALAAANTQAAPSRAATPSVSPGGLEAEIARVEKLIRQISEMIDDPAIELSTVIRKNVERAEFEAYLRGIRYALNGE